MELNEIPLLIENVDISCYRAADRKIRHVFNGASEELVAMVINFAHSRDLGVPGSHDRRRWDLEGGGAEDAAGWQLLGVPLRSLARYGRWEGEVPDIPPHRPV